MNTIKCVIIGDGTVGKTCILLTYTTNQFPGDYVPTVFDNYSANVMVDNKIYNLALWDTAGQEEYDYLRPLSYENTDIFVVCFSVMSITSFNNIKLKWIPEIKKYKQNCKYVLVGTKIDMRTDYDQLKKLHNENSKPLTYEQGYQLAKDINAELYIECSSLTQKNINLLFTEVVRCVSRDKNNKNKEKKNCIIL